ncbi:MAG TPA: AI-2E family transporter [Pseudobacteroides sp.]|uniref:AI-2E family transporter n=1 Tax=Pseudobacteroides sp. TaxID=1968840 RepID=UPI002F940AE0
MWIKNNFFKYSIGIIILLVIVFLLGQIDFFIAPFKKFIAIVFFPLLFALMLYYIFRPVIRLLSKKKIPKTPSILIVFFVFLLIFSLVGIYAGSLIVKESQQLADDMPQILEKARIKADELIKNKNIAALFSGKINEQLTSYAKSVFPAVKDGLVSAASAVASATSVLVVVPFILFYLLRDDRNFYAKVISFLPVKYKNPVAKMLKETDKTLSNYITGQALIALILGVLSYIGYLIVGLKYSFILAFLVMITSFIPMLGAIIGVVPAFFVGLSVSPFMALKVLIVAIVVQQLEGNFISPNLMGKRLAIHPLTIIILFLGAASLYGFIGMLIAVPAYAAFKVIAAGGMKIFRIWKSGNI